VEAWDSHVGIWRGVATYDTTVAIPFNKLRAGSGGLTKFAVMARNGLIGSPQVRRVTRGNPKSEKGSSGVNRGRGGLAGLPRPW
jgi:hypothetical protein